MVILFLILNTNIVHASCSLEEQVKINNAAGAVNAVASRLDYSYEDHDDDLNEDITTNGYTGIVYVYNLTDAIYFEISDGTSREKYTSNDDVNGAVAVSTGSMAVVKNYTILIYSTNKACSSSAVRTIQVTIPRYNEYFEST